MTKLKYDSGLILQTAIFLQGGIIMATHVRANMKRREDGAVREVMKRLLRSDLRFHKTDCGRFGAMTAWGLKDTSSRPAKDLGGTLRRTSKTTPRSYDNRASGDLLCSHRQGCVANVTRIESY